MKNQKKEFYFSRNKLYIILIVSLAFVFLGVSMIIFGNRSGDMFFAFLGLLTAAMFFVLFIANILKLSRDYPYIRITDEYIQLDSYTRSEITVYFEEIEYIRASQVQLQPLIEIELVDQKKFFRNMSLYNKFRLFLNSLQLVSTVTISARVLENEEHILLIDALNLLIEKINKKREDSFIPFILSDENKDQFKAGEAVQAYEIKPKVDRSMDSSYIIKSYKRSFKYFKISFIAIYWLLTLGNRYLLYILANLLLYPIAKLPYDYWFGFRLDQIYSDPSVFGSWRYRSSFPIVGLMFFQISIFTFPIGLLFLLTRKISSKFTSINLPIKSAFKELKKEKLAMGRRERNKSILVIIIGVLAIIYKPMEILELFEKYPGWFFSLLPLRVLISQILAIRKIKVYEKEKQYLLVFNFFIGMFFLGLFFLIFIFSSSNDPSTYILYLLIAMTNFLNPFTSGLTEKGVYYKHFNIRNFFGYKPVYYKYKELSSMNFETGGKEIKFLIHANILKANSKKTLVFKLKDMTAINRMLNEISYNTKN